MGSDDACRSQQQRLRSQIKVMDSVRDFHLSLDTIAQTAIMTNFYFSWMTGINE
jgi:hypothetical protein